MMVDRMGILMETKILAVPGNLNACSECVKNSKTIDRLCFAIEGLRGTEGINQEALHVTSHLLQVLPIGLLVYQYQPQGELFYFSGNPEGIRLLGASRDGCRGTEFDEMWPNARMQGLTEALMNTAQTGALFETDTACFRKEQTERVFRLRAFSLTGNLLGILLQDLNDRIPCEALPAESPEDFEKTVELGPSNPFSDGRSCTTGTAREDPWGKQALGTDDPESSNALGKLGELLETIEAMALKVLSRLELGYFSLAKASVEQILQDVEQAVHYVTLLRQAGPALPITEEIRKGGGSGRDITFTVREKAEKETP
jgi:hypothetical protein